MLAEIFGPELLIVLAVILVLFGGSQLPKLARGLGSAQREFTMAIRRGEVSLDEVLARASELEQRISGLKVSSSLPERPDTDLIQDWMVRTYLGRWADTT